MKKFAVAFMILIFIVGIVFLASDVAICGGNGGGGGSTPITLPPGDYSSDGDLSIAGSTEVVLTGGQYIFSSLHVSGNSTITIDPTTTSPENPVQIWVTGDIQMTGNGITNESPPTHLFIFDGSPDVEDSWHLCGNGRLSAAVFAPGNTMQISGGGNNGDAFGSFIAKTITLNGANTAIHYDEALSDEGGGPVYVGVDKSEMTWVIQIR